MTSTNLRPGHSPAETHAVCAGSDTSAIDDQPRNGTHSGVVVDGPLSHPAKDATKPSEITPGGTLLPESQAGPDIQWTHALGESSCTDDHPTDETHEPDVVGAPSPATPTTNATKPMAETSGWLELRIWAEMFEDSQKARIAQNHRAQRGNVDPVVYAPHIERLVTAEHQCRLALGRTYRRVTPEPIKAWQKASTGIGDSSLARILGHLGHPVHATPHHWEGTGSKRTLIDDPPYARTVGQLWQFCGHGAPGRKWKGMTADDVAAQGKPTLKMLVHLMAESAIKEKYRSTTELLAGHQQPDDCMWRYRHVYEQSRLATAEKEHTVECVRCGPSGKPAQQGDPWSAGHQHAHALRIVGKEILRDLWIAAGGPNSAA